MDLESYFAGLGTWAEAREQSVEVHRYGSHPEQVAELRLPEGEFRAIAVLVHGGFWRARFDRTTLRAPAVDLVQRGWAVWNVEYRRVGCEGGIPETLDDVSPAVDALAERLPAAGPDAAIVAIGHSAGGQLALWLGGAGRVQAAASLAGVCDLTEAGRVGLGDGAAVDFAGGTPDEQPAAYALADPFRRLPTGVPQLIVHGDADDRVPVEQSRRYAAAARRAGDRCQLLELPGVDHFTIIDPRRDAWPTAVGQLQALL